MNTFRLTRNDFGKLIFASMDRTVVCEGVVPVRAFPIAAPDDGIALVDPDGHELAWIDRLADLPEPERVLIEEELRQREFLPEIHRIVSVSSFAVPSTWEVATNRGAASFALKSEEDIRRIGSATLMIADSHGVQYLVRDIASLDRASKRLLDRFL